MGRLVIGLQGSLPSSMLFRRFIFTSIVRSDLHLLPFPIEISGHLLVPSKARLSERSGLRFRFQRDNSWLSAPFRASRFRMGDARRPPTVSLPPVTANEAELLRGLEAALGSPFSSEPLSPSPNPLIIVISGPSGVGKDAVIKGLQEVRKGIHFVVTATSRPKRAGEVDGKDYYFVTKEDFLSMIERNELLEYALVYGDYKGIPKQQVLIMRFKVLF
ncbi:hypothetical protein NE237_002747 [Protea cynaroides]|uniref:Guanylate kinase-like domain-containing protein n=1 Tax=Protea cynaroides TaxID=273540 RepID=A0A9Q0KFF3_9MAGN|nr:hypothetical protein NE237_002747 [Protea cynaroides]